MHKHRGECTHVNTLANYCSAGMKRALWATLSEKKQSEQMSQQLNTSVTQPLLSLHKQPRRLYPTFWGMLPQVSSLHSVKCMRIMFFNHILVSPDSSSGALTGRPEPRFEFFLHIKCGCEQPNVIDSYFRYK